MIRTAGFRTIWNGVRDACRSSCAFVAILGVILWLHVYVENVVSIVESNVNVCLVATPALSWLIYREYNTNGGASCNEYDDTTASHGIQECGLKKSETGTRVGYRYCDCPNGGDRLTQGQHRGLPDDVFIHVSSFLHPRDVTSLASVNQSSLEQVDGTHFTYEDDERGRANKYYDYGHGGIKLNWKTRRLQLKYTRKRITSNQLWKSLWYRDYGQVLLAWFVGREAIRRSLQQPRVELAHPEATVTRTKTSTNSDFNEVQRKNKHKSAPTKDDNHSLKLSLAQKLDTIPDMKYFYFSFLETYLDYILAGQNTPELCLLGIHGHIFDFTKFADHHPGLSEPIRLECGKDATQYFEDLPHSSVARKIARKLCVLIDRACLTPTRTTDRTNVGAVAGCGLYRPPVVRWSVEDSNSRPPKGEDGDGVVYGLDRVLPRTSFTERRRVDCLWGIRDRFDRERRRKVSVASWVTVYSKLNASVFCARRFGGEGENAGGGARYPLITNMHRDGRIHVYYDPFDQRWKSWYTRVDYQPSYCELD